MALDTMIVFGASYDNEDDAVADYESVKKLYKDTDLLDTYDAAVVSKHDDGKVKIVKKHEQPTRHGAWGGLGIGIVGGALVALFPAITLGGALIVGGVGGGALEALAGHVTRGMSRGDLKELGELLDDGQSGLVVVAATDMESRVQDALNHAAKVTKKELRADEKALEAEIDEAAKT
jgi:uncharacterized membrane protein